MSEQEQQATKSAKKTLTGPGYLEVIIIALVIAVGVVAGYNRYFDQKIKVFDLKGYVRTQKSLLAAGVINQEQCTANLDKVERTLNREAADPNHIILLKELVLKNGDEIRVK